jgi:membrane protein DedA with SNARE-associated domain
MSLAALIAHYGYYALFLGALLEGEAVLLAAGFAAHRGMLSLPWVVVVAFIAGTLGDQLAFSLGRHRGEAIVSRFPRLAARVPKIRALIARHHTWLILIGRFMYGLRIVGPMVLGMSGIYSFRFAMLNMIGAMFWAVTIALAGYWFGAAMEWVFTDLKRFEEAVLLGILLVGAGYSLWRRHKERPIDPGKEGR